MLRLYTPVYAVTLLLSAALLFSVQPLFSKMILPLLGGTPQVWNTAMLFFQLMLLGGYAYAHGTSRFLNVRVQAILHIILLGIFTVVLPLSIPEDWIPPFDRDPTLWQLGVMFMTVGGPFFVLSGSAPMLQRWFAGTNHPDADNPYFLYGASNLGSMTALLAYPVVIEPLFALDMQSWIWMVGYIALIGFTAFSALLVWKNTQHASQAPEAANDHSISWSLRFRWLFLAFIPSSLMLGVTTYITTDIATVPLLWIMPLALYVGTFIIVFARKPLLPKSFIMNAFMLSLCVLLVTLVCFRYVPMNPFLLMGIHLTLFFFAALLCHQELADSRPSASHLTEFYLVMSIGGAIGGFFNAIIAPNYFIIPVEYAFVLTLACFMRYATDQKHSFAAMVESLKNKISKDILDGFLTFNTLLLVLITFAGIVAFNMQGTQAVYAAGFVIICGLYGLSRERWSFGLAFLILMVMFPPGYFWRPDDVNNVIFQDRNFFGVIRVINQGGQERRLLHGTTVHGAQAIAEEHKMEPLSYYGESSPIRDVFAAYDRVRGKQEVAVIGLGIGVTACFQKDGRHFDFYEIDPDIVAVAENTEFFTYMKDCGTPYDIILGDGRLTVRDKPEKHYDIIMLDAFSSDNIPIHLLTLDAIQIYLSKLKDDGIIVFNASNRYIDLEPVLAKAAEEIGIPSYAHVTDGGTIEGTELKYYPAHFVAMTNNDRHIDFLKNAGWSESMFRDGVRVWTDKYSNILSVFGNEVGFIRTKQMVEKQQAEEEAAQAEQ